MINNDYEFYNNNSKYRNRMLALAVYIFIHSPEFEKKIFNIISIWEVIFPDDPLWKMNKKLISVQISKDPEFIELIKDFNLRLILKNSK